MEIINSIDEQGRLYKVKYYISEKSIQMDSHGYSYLYCRRLFESCGRISALGLEEKTNGS